MFREIRTGASGGSQWPSKGLCDSLANICRERRGPFRHLGGGGRLMPSGSDAATTIRLATPSAVLGGFRGLVPSEATPPRRVGLSHRWRNSTCRMCISMHTRASPTPASSSWATSRAVCAAVARHQTTQRSQSGRTSMLRASFRRARKWDLVHVAVDTLCPEVGYP